MNLRSAALALSLATFASAGFAQANNFTLVGKTGKPIGKASYTMAKLKDGFQVKTRFEYRFAPVATQSNGTDPSASTGFLTEAQMSAEYKVDPTGLFLSGFTQNGSTQALTSFTPSKPRDVVTVGQMQGGVNLGSKTLPMPKPEFYIAPDYDPAGIQVLLTSAINHPHADHVYLLLIPGTGAGPKAGNSIANIAIGEPDTNAASGTLDGKPVTLKHYPLVWNKSKGDAWTDADGNLMQIKVGPLNASYVRNKFVLTEAPASTDAPAK